MPKLNLEITSPSGILFNDQCHMAVIPSANGEIGVMHGHEAVISALKEGKVSIFDEKEKLIKEFDVTSGFAEMQGIDKLLVLID